MSAENLDYLLKMPRGPLACEGFDVVHGSPVDEDQYLVNVNDAALQLPHLRSPVTFFGHTHVQGGFLVSDARRNQDRPGMHS